MSGTITCITVQCPLYLIRWMENISLEAIATCFYPAEIRGQRVQDVSVFTSCLEKGSPLDETVVAHSHPKLEKQKLRRAKTPVLKVRPVTPKAKSDQLSKTRPQPRAVASKVAKN